MMYTLKTRRLRSQYYDHDEEFMDTRILEEGKYFLVWFHKFIYKNLNDTFDLFFDDYIRK